jgi:acetyl-CoA carboxylase biotin carboxyl carrier protein
MASLEPVFELEGSQYRILSPAVGNYSMSPKNGAFLSEGAFIGRIKILNSFYDLYLPKGVYGKVTVDQDKDKHLYVEYLQELFRLNPDKNILKPEKKRKGSTPAEDQKSEEGYIISAFTTGIFYRKPSPDASPYVSVGQKIEKGNILGLIEVMKTFNHIVFQGTDTTDSGKIKKIFVQDSQEVKLGEPLFLIDNKS